MNRIICVCVCLLGIIINNHLVTGDGHLGYEALFPFHFSPITGVELQCPTDWTARGSRCYKFYDEPLSAEDAQDVCSNKGAELARIPEMGTNLFIGSLAAEGTGEYWIGGEASDADLCPAAINDEASQFPKTDVWCNKALSFVCHREACASDQFMCRNHGCVKDTYECDGEDDCGDNSDEQNCPDSCHYYEVLGSQSSASINSPSYPSFYGHQKNCQWLLEGPVGSRLEISFNSFKTEKHHDILSIYVGRSTFHNDLEYVASYSGNLNNDKPKPVISTNNYALLHFVSDPDGESSSTYRFLLSWTTTDAVSNTETVLDAATSVPMTFSSPNFDGDGYPINTKATWVIEAESEWDLVTVMFSEVHLAEGDKVTIHDGKAQSDSRLAEFEGPISWSDFPDFVTSSGRSVYIVMDTESSSGDQGFQFSYKSGCVLELVNDWGAINSPGMDYGWDLDEDSRLYAKLQTCTYHIKLPESSLNLNLSLTLNIDLFNLQDVDDSFEVFFGAEESDVADVGCSSSNSGACDSPIMAPSGEMFIKFKTDAKNGEDPNRLGFRAKYSVGCEDPDFNANTIVPDDGTFTSDYTSSFVIECDAGYYFAQQEFDQCGVTPIVSGTEVSLACEFKGRWNANRLPECRAVYCVDVPEVANGFISHFTSAEFGGRVEYECFVGFTMEGATNASNCESDGEWSTPPTCKAKECPDITASDSAALNVTVINQDGTDFGSVVTFDCNEGYQLTAGDPVILCLSNGSWSGPHESADVVCSPKTCMPPPVRHGMINGGSLDLVDYGLFVDLICNEGYVIENTTSDEEASLECLADETFGEIPRCVNRNECEVDDPCTSPAECDDNDGGYVCNCPTGYEPSSLTACDEIDECAEETHSCYDNDHCENTPLGSYTCTCPTGDGLVLFTDDGMHGFHIRDGETGTQDGDVYQLNHTCIPNICPDPLNGTDAFANGQMLVHDKEYFYSGETVTFLCDLGYGIDVVAVDSGPEQKQIECGNNGDWIEAVPECTAIKCASLDSQDDWIATPRNAPDFWPMGSNEEVAYGEMIYMNCSVSGRDPEMFVRSRSCLYDVDQGRYAIIGDPLDCGYIDCGEVENIPGIDTDVLPDPASDETIYGQTFTFTCAQGFTKEGNSSIDDSTVTCQANGHWDLNDLRCIGESCTYPGRPADGSLIIDSFEDGMTGTYECDKPGYTADPPTITCVRASDETMKWDTGTEEVVPPLTVTCVDTEAPVFTNCPEEDVYVYRYDTVDLEPEWTDNSKALETLVSAPALDQPVLADVEMTWTATDHAGNATECVFMVLVINERLPLFTEGCPESKVYYLDEQSTDMTVSVSEEFGVNVTGYAALEATSRFEPATFTVNEASLYQTQVLTQIAMETGRESNTATCTFSVVVMPSPCAMWAFDGRAPLHGSVSTTNATRAMVSCDDGFTFYGIEDTELLYDCDGDNGFVNNEYGDYIPECVSPTDAAFTQQIQLTYEPDNDIVGDVDAYLDYLISDQIPQAETFVLESEENVPECYKQNRGTTVNITFNRADDVQSALTSLSVTYTITYNAQNNGFLELCQSFYRVYFETVGSPSNFPLLKLSAPGEVELIGQAYNTIVSDYSCPEGQALKIYIDPDNLQISSCTACAPGTYFDSDIQNCTKCPIGTYQDEAGTLSCKNCTAGTYTYAEGAASDALCYEECLAPLTSATRLGSCSACDSEEFWTDASSCSPCSGDTRTRGPQGPGNDTGCYALCEIGYFSYDGYGPDCRPCPIGYYTDSPGAAECIGCTTGQTTVGIASNSSDLCFTPNNAYCDSVCVNHTDCSAVDGLIACDCIDGFSGQYCDVDIDECASDPCFYGGRCLNEVNGYTCECPSIPFVQIQEHANMEVSGVSSPDVFEVTGVITTEDCRQTCVDDPECGATTFLDINKCFQYNVAVLEEDLVEGVGSVTYVRFFNDSQVYGGERCEDEPDDCPAESEFGYCENGSGCKDLIGDYECLCRTNLEFSGETCKDSDPVCTDVDCMNEGECVAVSNIRYICECAAGFTGTHCETNINDCDPNPCLYGGECEDQVDGFDCACPTGFTGDNCETRPSNLCSGNSCGSSAVCVEDYRDSSPLCLCQSGDTSESYYTLWINEDDPETDGGDFETPADHGNVCGDDTIMEIECRVVGTETSASTSRDMLYTDCTLEGGVVCYNENNTAMCEDYEVRYKCQVDGEHCRDIDECTLYMCENGATCDNEQDDYSCDCVDGYDGYNCQHDIDECEDMPCVNGGTCHQYIDYYNCTCAEGFEGFTCATNINDCASDPCDETGTEECEDLVADFHCVCNPGYTGRNCSENIEECMSEPCYHNGECLDRIDEYTCECTPGWTGDRCEEMVDYCDEADCQNGGECFEVFQDFFCSCKAGYSDRECTTGPELCEIADPCLNGGTCNVNDDGEVECLCPEDYTGDGCQCQKDYCSEEDGICQNEAECTVFELGTYNCDCKPGFTGTNCETNIDDCDGVSCGSGQCRDGVDVAYCACEFGKIGDGCDKDVYRNYDLESTQKGETCLLRPFTLNTTAFSLALWIRVVSTMDPEGVILNLYTAESETSREKGDNLLQLTIEGVKMDFEDDELDFDIAKHFNEGQWHHIVLSADEGEIKVYVDASSVTYDATLEMLPEYGLICLGPEPFAGVFSLVQMWSRPLSAAEVSQLYSAALSDDDVTEELSEGLLLDWGWGSYTPGPGVFRISDSTRGQKKCRLGETVETDDTGSSSCVLVADKHPPTIMDCPMDIDPKLPEEGERFVTFDWDAAGIFEGVVGQGSNYPEEVFETGSYDVWYTAVDSAGNREFCRFDVFVRLGDCKHVLPTDAEDECDEDGCDLTCLTNFDHVEDYPDVLPCGPAGIYNTQAPLERFRLPECGATSTTEEKSLTFGWTYQMDVTVNDNILDNIKTSLLAQITAWGSTTGGFCINNDCTNLVIEVTNLAESGQAGVQVVADCVSGVIDTTDTEDLLRQAALQDGNFYLSDISTGASIVPVTFFIDSVLCCPVNNQIVDDFCVECPKGTYFEETDKTCVKCPQGEYQENAGQLECTSCDDGQTTETEGSTDAADCIDICEAGHKYSDTDGACVACGLGFYQPEAGQTFCLACDLGKTTNLGNSTSETDCFDTCEDGNELRPNGSCQICPIGTFRQQGVQSKCTQCEDGLVTAEEGGVTAADCTVRICEAGQFVVDMDCVACPEDTYRSAEMENCTACPEQTRTEGTGRVSQNECLFFCPAGKFVDNSTGTLVCTLCPRDSYKEGETYDTECMDCPDNTPRTAGSGATSRDECRFGNCMAGEYVDPDNVDQCLSCPYDTYQENPDPVFNVDNCTACEENFGTKVQGANSSAMCMAFCPSGSELSADSEDCVDCPQGYFKDNDVDQLAKFAACTRCPVDVVTAEEGATSADQCDQGNCTAGEFAEGDECSPCPVGFYSEEKWQTECTRCEDRESTTAEEGADSSALCNVYPNRTKIYFKIELNIQWQQSFTDMTDSVLTDILDKLLNILRLIIEVLSLFRSGINIRSVTRGSLIVMGEVLFSNDAEALNQLLEALNSEAFANALSDDGIPLVDGSNVVVLEATQECGAGYSLNDDNDCEVCPLNTYQPNAVTSLCLPCADGEMTAEPGSTAETDCIRECEVGQEDDNNGGCTECADDSASPGGIEPCVACTGDYITYNNKQYCGESCSPGEFSELSTVTELGACTPCPQGTYSSLSNSLQCEECPDGLDTAGPGSINETACENPCNLDEDYCNNGDCSFTDNQAKCTCDENYIGERCTERTDPSENKDNNLAIIIGASVGGAAALILLILLIVCCARANGGESRSKAYPPQPMAGGQMMYPPASVPSAYAPSVGGYYPNTSYYPTYGGQSIIMDPTQAAQPYDNTGYMFYDEKSELANGAGSSNNPYTMQSYFQR